MDIFKFKPGSTEIGYVLVAVSIAIAGFIGIWAAIHNSITFETSALVGAYLGGGGYMRVGMAKYETGQGPTGGVSQ
jgi:hypothetical protein